MSERIQSEGRVGMSPSNTFPATDAPGLLREGCACLGPEGRQFVLLGSHGEGWTVADQFGSAWWFTNARVTIDCDRPAARDVTVRWFAEQGLDYGWARDIPGALVEGVRRLKAGEEPLLGVLEGPLGWKTDPHGIHRLSFFDQGKAVWMGLALGRRDERQSQLGWRVCLFVHQEGPETGEEGKRLAEAAVRRRYWVTEPARCLKPIHHTHHGEVLASTLCVREEEHEGDCLDALAAP